MCDLMVNKLSKLHKKEIELKSYGFRENLDLLFDYGSVETGELGWKSVVDLARDLPLQKKIEGKMFRPDKIQWF